MLGLAMGEDVEVYVSAGGVAIAFLSLIVAAISLYRSSKANKRAIAESERALAEAVYCSPLQINSNAARYINPVVDIGNRSDMPIFNVSLTLNPRYECSSVHDGKASAWVSEANAVESTIQIGQLESGEERKVYVDDEQLYYIWKWKIATDEADSNGRRSYQLPDHVSLVDCEIELMFRDARGLWWGKSLNSLIKIDGV